MAWNLAGNIRGPQGAPGVGGGSTPIAATLTNATLVTETVVANFAIPANHLAAGSVLNVRLGGQVSAAATLIYRIRFGTMGTIVDPLVIQFATTAAGVANAHTSMDALVSALTATTLTAHGQAQLVGATVGPTTGAFAPATVNLTVANRLLVTVQQSVAQTFTTRTGALSKII